MARVLAEASRLLLRTAKRRGITTEVAEVVHVVDNLHIGQCMQILRPPPGPLKLASVKLLQEVLVPGDTI